MNKFLQYINEILESLDIYTNSKSNNIKSSTRKQSKNKYIKEN